MLKANIESWSIVLYPQIYKHKDSPSNVYARIDCNMPVALFGRAKDDPRHNPLTGEFKDGNRIVSSLIIKIESGVFFTENTIYAPGKISEDYLAWCKEKDYNVFDVKDYVLDTVQLFNKEEPESVNLRHICENCGKEEILTSEFCRSRGA